MYFEPAEKNSKRIFRTYTSEEVIEALEYIKENKVKKYEFKSQVVNRPDGQRTMKVIRPMFLELGDPFVFLFDIDSEDRKWYKVANKIDKSEMPSIPRIDILKEVMEKINSETFEGWCPDWDEVNFKHPHENLR